MTTSQCFAGCGNSMSAHGLRLMRMAGSSNQVPNPNVDLDASDEAGCAALCEIASVSTGSNPKQQERQPHHSKHFSCPLEKSSCALLAEEEEEEEEWENERPDCNSCGRGHACWPLCWICNPTS